MYTKQYHIHTYRCKHANGDVIDYCNSAIENGIKVLGISDHSPFPDNRWQFERMSFKEIDDYNRKIDNVRKNLPSDSLILLKSLECDYVEKYQTYYKIDLLEKFNLDYLIGSVHWFPQNGNWIRVPGKLKDKNALYAYTKHYIKAMKSGFFLFMAHPDIFGIFYPIWDKYSEECSIEILKTAEILNLPIEINSHGYRKSYIKTQNGLIRKYPLNNFWELASNFQIKVVISSDAHYPEDIVRDLDKCHDIVKKFKLNIADLSFLESKYQ